MKKQDQRPKKNNVGLGGGPPCGFVLICFANGGGISIAAHRVQAAEDERHESEAAKEDDKFVYTVFKCMDCGLFSGVQSSTLWSTSVQPFYRSLAVSV